MLSCKLVFPLYAKEFHEYVVIRIIIFMIIRALEATHVSACHHYHRKACLRLKATLIGYGEVYIILPYANEHLPTSNSYTNQVILYLSVTFTASFHLPLATSGLKLYVLLLCFAFLLHLILAKATGEDQQQTN